MERIIDKIRKEYPNPITLKECMGRGHSFFSDIKDDYCVGIAGLRWWLRNKPGEEFPVLLSAAKKIEVANDAGNFELAWELLGKALDGK